MLKSRNIFLSIFSHQKYFFFSIDKMAPDVVLISQFYFRSHLNICRSNSTHLVGIHFAGVDDEQKKNGRKWMNETGVNRMNIWWLLTLTHSCSIESNKTGWWSNVSFVFRFMIQLIIYVSADSISRWRWFARTHWHWSGVGRLKIGRIECRRDKKWRRMLLMVALKRVLDFSTMSLCVTLTINRQGTQND